MGIRVLLGGRGRIHRRLRTPRLTTVRPHAARNRIQNPAPIAARGAPTLPRMATVAARPVRKTADADVSSSTQAIARAGVATARAVSTGRVAQVRAGDTRPPRPEAG